jgi:D-sedoheptulose 7-phosphate isomerase
MTGEQTGFLYPFIESGERDAGALLANLAASARAKARESAALQRATLAEWAGQVRQCAAEMATRFTAGGRLYTFGNGGSATDCATLTALFTRPPAGGARPLPARDLTADQAVVTALANDVGFDLVFSRQIIAYGQASTPGTPGGSLPRASTDMAVAFSTSGSSRDLMAALREARGRGLLTIGFAGYAGGEMTSPEAVDYCFVVRSQSVHRIQESQALLACELWAAVQQELGDIP